MTKNNRLGEINYNNHNSKMIIIEYENCDNLTVKFEKDNCIVKNRTYVDFRKGKIKSPYDRGVCNIGYVGEGIYRAKDNNNNITPQYNTWSGMLYRCYSERIHNIRPTYIDCTVCEEWQNLQNFGKWYDENYYEIEEQRMDLDKDILHKGNKIYSPENCVFVPTNINGLFTKRQNCRGNFPIGVSFDKSKNLYAVGCGDGKGNYVKIGTWGLDYKEEAFQVYKETKEKVIKDIAIEYKNKYIQFPEQLYETMINYKVSITD